MAEQEQDFSNLPLEERFVHKAWKVRKEAYEAAAKEFALSPDESAAAFTPFHQSPELWKGAAADSNVAAQVEGLAALCAFLKHGGPTAASRSRSHTIQAITDKAVASTRPAAKQHAVEALLLYIENDKPDLVLEEVLPAMSHKQPKVAAASIAAITSLYHNFGTRVVDPKPVLKQLPKAFGHADKNIRAEAQALAVELYRWHRDAIKTHFWGDLKPVQQADLDKLFEKVKDDPPPQQQRFTRAQQAQQAAAAAAAAANQDAGGDDQPGYDAGDDADGGNDPDAAQDDAFDLAEPVDVVAKMPADFFEMIASTKWKERKDTLDALFAVLDTPRIKDTPVDDVVRALAKCMKDANVAVVTVAAHCIEKLALGLRRAFAKHRSSVLEPVFERLKEKKQSVTDALGAALDAVFQSSSMSDCLETTIGFLSHKNPNVKAETAKFLIRCLRTTRDVPSKPEQKQIADAGTKLLTESTEQMRAAGAEVLGTLMKIIGERGMNGYLEGLDEIRKNKIKEFYETAQVKAKERPKPIVAPPTSRAGVGATSAVGKKVVGGAKKAPVKKVAPAPTPALAPQNNDIYDDQPPKPPPKGLSRPGAKPGLAAPNGLKLGTLKRPGLASPQPRKLVSPSEDEPPAPSPSSKFGAGRGLTSKPLGRPALQPKSPPPSAPAPSALSSIQLAELDELRTENDRLTTLAENLRSSNTKLLAEISELQNQNAQLIEDHTRDVLQIKAKETQLTRARGESDVLRGEMESLKKECERYKRELSRLGRESLGRDREELRRTRLDDAFDVPSNNNNTNGYGSANVNANGNGNGNANSYANSALYDDLRQSSTSRPISGTALHRPSSAASANSARSGFSTTTKPLRSSNLSPTDEKENHNAVDALAARRKLSPPTTGLGIGINTGVGLGAYPGGAASPVRPPAMSRESSAPGSHAGGGSDSGVGDSREPGKPENWKRAAEVTSQLKARIEAMKARQGLQQRH